jgi:hypothetical protein
VNRRIAPASKDKTSQVSPVASPPISFSRTVSSRIRDAGITHEQVLLLQKCGLTITDCRLG